MSVTEREALDLKIRSTIEWHFGTICDLVAAALTKAGVSPLEIDEIKRSVRKEGNEARRVIGNHLNFVHIVRNNRADPINKDRVARRFQKG